jgi:hypothetical protein
MPLLTDDARVVIYDCNMFIIPATGAYSRRGNLKDTPLGQALALLANIIKERLATDKHSSFFSPFVCKEEKQFYYIDSFGPTF